ncbi:MAG TPA: VCBS repeat-containing protein [Verrucomicrobiae bacterium]|nr:VCBS repeat-containing protein [Verrucomicrobiae bacterium]
MTASDVGFSKLSSDISGITFQNALTPQDAAQNQVRMNGSGVTAGDVNGDGLADLFFTSAGGENKLYLNQGDFRFQDFTSEAGLRFPKLHFTGAALADLDGDSDLDLLVGSIGGGLFLFANDATGHFTNVTPQSGLSSTAGNMTFAIADVDGDGLLDVYVTNYRTNTVRSTGLKLLNVNGKSVLMPEDRGKYELTAEGKLLEYGEPDQFFRNIGGNKFTLVAWTSGAFLAETGDPLSSAPADWGLSAMFRDLNEDGSPDLYVCNDFFTPDRVWLNDGRGHFGAAPPEMMRVTSAFSMGVDVADFNRDGHDDVFVVDMLAHSHRERLRQGTMMSAAEIAANRRRRRSQEIHNTLFAARGDGTFAEISQFAGVNASDWSWCPVALDVDLDGFEDILITTGHLFDTQDLDGENGSSSQGGAQTLLKRAPLDRPNRAFRNLRNFQFQECGREWGFADVGVSHGICLADLDNDGDMDVVINNLNAPAGIYRNESKAPRVAVRLKGKAPNTKGIGARIVMYGGGLPEQSQQIICGGRYLSSDDPVRSFAAGSTTNALKAEVIWRNGKRSILNPVKPNTIVVIDEAEAEAFEPQKKPVVSALFVDTSHFIQSRHNEPDFDDFARQPALPRKLSELGPGVSWGDLNGDDKEDLVVGPGAGEELEILFNRGDGQFSRQKTGRYIGTFPDDTAGVICLPSTPNEGLLMVARASYESGQTNSLAIYAVTNGVPALKATLSLGTSSVGPVAVADVDGDGDLDMFVGARVIPGRYPEPPVSRLYVKNGDSYLPVQEFHGLVSGAVFSDLDLDGYPELILAGDWGPIRVLKRLNGRFIEMEAGLEKFSGWWNGVTTADFDGDGRLDIVASNWGRNTKYEPLRNKPLRVHYGAWTNPQRIDMMETFWDDQSAKEMPIRGLEVLRRSSPQRAEKFPTHAAFSTASISQILGAAEDHTLEVATLESMVFLNRGESFVSLELPVEAQWAPCFGVSAADVDGDGAVDLFLSQNFTALDDDTSRAVEGRGVLLRGNGDGSFKSMSSAESGIAVYGDGRGCAFCDYNADGRVDLAVAQNKGVTRLFRNARATPGIRVRLRGPLENTVGAGAVARMKSGGRLGPAHEVKLGSGYWSQESRVLILPRGEEIAILWPGGKKSAALIPPNATEITIDYR